MGTPAKQKALRKVLREAPCSIRALAREAGVDHGDLTRARDGTRNLTAHMADRIIAALRRWAETCDRLADELETATKEGGKR